MEILKCKGCGANVKAGSASCEYCGAQFSVKETNSKPENKINEQNQTPQQQTYNADINYETELAKERISWFVIAITFVCFWPVGLALVIAKLNRKKK